MSRNHRLYIEDMHHACRRILADTHGLSREQILAEGKTRDAVLWNLLVLGEAAKAVPEHVRQRHPDIEWRKIAGLRDVLAHGYFGIDDNMVYDVLANKVPGLLETLDSIAGS